MCMWWWCGNVVGGGGYYYKLNMIDDDEQGASLIHVSQYQIQDARRAKQDHMVQLDPDIDAEDE